MRKGEAQSENGLKHLGYEHPRHRGADARTHMGCSRPKVTRLIQHRLNSTITVGLACKGRCWYARGQSTNSESLGFEVVRRSVPDLLAKSAVV